MRDILIRKLHDYLLLNNPDILIYFQQEGDATQYLEEKVQALDDLPQQLLAEGKPAYIVEEICMDELTKEFRPSRYNYLLSVLEDDFQAEYSQWRQSGILTYEIINLLQPCNAVFELLNFSEENEDDQKLRYAIIRTIQLHLVGVCVDTEYLDNIEWLEAP